VFPAITSPMRSIVRYYIFIRPHYLWVIVIIKSAYSYKVQSFHLRGSFLDWNCVISYLINMKSGAQLTEQEYDKYMNNVALYLSKSKDDLGGSSFPFAPSHNNLKTFGGKWTWDEFRAAYGPHIEIRKQFGWDVLEPYGAGKSEYEEMCRKNVSGRRRLTNVFDFWIQDPEYPMPAGQLLYTDTTLHTALQNILGANYSVKLKMSSEKGCGVIEVLGDVISPEDCTVLDLWKDDAQPSKSWGSKKRILFSSSPPTKRKFRPTKNNPIFQQGDGESPRIRRVPRPPPAVPALPPPPAPASVRKAAQPTHAGPSGTPKGKKDSTKKRKRS